MMNAQTMLELADDIADIPHEVNLTPRQARLLQEAANRLRESLALPPSQEVAAQPQRMWSAPAEFVMWALMEGVWQGADVDGGAAQDKAVELDLIVATPYDPKEHGETAYCEPGDQWFVPSEALLAALAGKPGAAHDQLSRLRQAILDNTQGDGFWLGEILLAVLAKETGFNGSVTRPDERCRYCDEAIEPGHDCSVTRPERCTPGEGE